MIKKVHLPFVFFFFLSPFFHLNAQDNWQWLHPWPQGNTLTTVKRINSNLWYAVGDRGTFIKTTDAGVTWSVNNSAGKLIAPAGRRVNINDVHFINAEKGIAVGEASSIMVTTDGGDSWFEAPGNPLTSSVSLTGVHFASSTLGYISGTDGVVLKSTDGGNNWSIIPSGLTTRLNDIWAPDDTIVVASTTFGSVIRSTDGGNSWNQHAPTFPFGEFKRMAGGDLFSGNFIIPLTVVGDQGRMMTSTDAGRIWFDWASGYTRDTSAMKDVQYSDTTWIISGFRDTVFISTSEFALNWTPVDMNVNAPGKYSRYVYSAFAGKRGDTIVAVGANGLIKSKMGSNSFAQLNTRIAKTGAIQKLWASPNSGLLIAVGDPSTPLSDDRVIRSTDRGLTWNAVTLPQIGNSSFWSLDMIDNETGFTASIDGVLLRTTDGGVSWSPVTGSAFLQYKNLTAMNFVSPLTGWVFCNTVNPDQRIYKTTDGGLTWNSQSITLPQGREAIYRSVFTDSLRGYISTAAPGIFSTTNGGLTWNRDSLADNYSGYLFDISMINGTTGFACGTGSKLYKTTNGGEIWNPVVIPGANETFFSVSQLDEYRVAVSGSSGNCYISFDGGVTWAAENLNSSNIIYSLNFTKKPGTNGWEIYAVGGGGMIMRKSLSVIPVELSSFNASVSGRSVILEWSTATETNNRGFEIERKTGDKWNGIGFIQGGGTRTYHTNYTFTDNISAIPAGTVIEYRLRQIDYDGTESLSGTVSVSSNELPSDFALEQNYPNPFNPSTVIRYAIPAESKVSLQIFDMKGELISEPVNAVQNTGFYEVTVNAGQLASGIYLYVINASPLSGGDNFRQTRKMILMK